jgi:hypothetical protein
MYYVKNYEEFFNGNPLLGGVGGGLFLIGDVI